VQGLAQNRLVTLDGPGGVGKTSIAVHAASTFGASCRDGVCFIDLTTISAGQNPLPAVVGALGFRPSSDETALEELTALLASRDQLLILDNCEHVIADAAAIVDTLAACPGIRVLATSRERLGLADEFAVDVPPLSIAAAADLFLRRAQTSVRGFEPTDDDVESARRIAVLVDGLPLAVELTSPLVRSMSPREIADELERGRLTSPQQRGRDPRHASMQDAVAWSYELLDAAARTLFERLSVFEAPTDLAGIIAVCSDPDDGSLPQSAVVEVLDGLVTRSLVAVERTSTGMTYRMLVPVQAFARRALDRSGEAGDVQLRHVHHVISELRANAQVVESADPLPGLVALERAAGNIRAAYRRCRELGDELLAAELVASMSTLAHEASTASAEWAMWARDALQTAGMPPRTKLRIMLAVARRHAGPELEQPLARDAVDLARELDDIDALTLAHTAVSDAIMDFDPEEAIRVGRVALALSDGASSPVFGAAVIRSLVNPLIRAQRFAEVSALLDPLLALGTHRFGLFEPMVLYQAGRAARVAGDNETGRRLFMNAEAAARRTGSLLGYSYARYGLAQVAFGLGDLDEALRLFEEVVEIDLLVSPSELWGDRMYLAMIAADLSRPDIVDEQVEALRPAQRTLDRAAYAIAAGCAARLNGFTEVAVHHLVEAARLFASAQHSEGVADILRSLASCVIEDGARDTLRAAASGLRSGSLTMDEAMRIMGTVEKLH
jgi:predicted ATPase